MLISNAGNLSLIDYLKLIFIDFFDLAIDFPQHIINKSFDSAI